MFDPTNTIDDLVKKITAVLPEGLGKVQEDVKQHVRAVVEACFARLNLVTREEFDTQVAVLARTREKLEALEKELHKKEKN